MRLLVLTTVLLAGLPQSAVERTAAGDLTITPIKHGTLMFEFGGQVIHVDPWSQADLSRYAKADWIVITDIHGDHFDAKGIEAVRKADTKMIGPAAVAEKLQEVMVVKNGETRTLGAIQVEAVPMYNLKRGPEAGKVHHDKGRGNGYIFTFGDKRVYVAGDTECTPEMRQLKNIDVAFLPMYESRTMPPEEAAECARAFKPKILYAYHYRDNDPTIARRMLADSGIEVRIAPQ